MRRNAFAQRVARHVLPARDGELSLLTPPVAPIGAKLELTFACNLRCGFCYTDSPRHTLARTPELDDAQWSAVVGDVIDLGILEAVVTGGEPFLRRDLALGVLERLDAAGVATYLNTNGWFIDDELADRLAAVRGLHVYVSIDGAGAARHDAMRGVPGSWKRAIGAVHRLLERGVPVRVPHVITPDNRQELPDALRAFARLGVLSMHFAPVTPIGAAARGGDWGVDRGPLADLRDEARRTHGGMNVELRGGEIDGFDPLHSAPATFLVRPDGIVRIGSSVPFSFGSIVEDGAAGCWERIREEWDGPRVTRWLDGVRRRSELADAEVVPYLDADTPVDPAEASTTPGGRGAPQPAASALSREDPLASIPAAFAHVTGLALSRRYRRGSVRAVEGTAGTHFVREIGSGAVTHLNATASIVLAACSDGTAGDAVEALAARYPGVPRETLVDDTVAALRMLLERRLLVPALAPAGERRGDAPEPAAALTA